jgi:hypothetical protein
MPESCYKLIAYPRYLQDVWLEFWLRNFLRRHTVQINNLHFKDPPIFTYEKSGVSLANARRLLGRLRIGGRLPDPGQGRRRPLLLAYPCRGGARSLLAGRGKSWGVEFKYEDAPRLTRSMKAAFEDLSLERLWVVYPGKTAYRLAEKGQVIPFADISDSWRYE